MIIIFVAGLNDHSIGTNVGFIQLKRLIVTLTCLHVNACRWYGMFSREYYNKIVSASSLFDNRQLDIIQY